MPKSRLWAAAFALAASSFFPPKVTAFTALIIMMIWIKRYGK